MSEGKRGSASATGRGLTPRQEHFAQLVASGSRSLTDAYAQAYPASKQWERDTLHRRAAELGGHGEVAGRVRQLRMATAETVALKAVEVLAQVQWLAHSDIGNVMYPDGRVKLPNEFDRETRAAIKKFKIDELGRIEYGFWDKGAALDKAMPHLGLYEKDNKQQAGGLKALRDALLGRVVQANPSAAQADDDETPDE